MKQLLFAFAVLAFGLLAYLIGHGHAQSHLLEIAVTALLLAVCGVRVFLDPT